MVGLLNYMASLIVIEIATMDLQSGHLLRQLVFVCQWQQTDDFAATFWHIFSYSVTSREDHAAKLMNSSDDTFEMRSLLHVCHVAKATLTFSCCCLRCME